MNTRATLVLVAVSFSQAGQTAFAADINHTIHKARLPDEAVHPRAVSSPWFARIGVVGALYDSSARVAANGQVLAGASAHVSNSVTITFDIGYEITKDIAVSLMLGVPPKPSVTGEGTLTSLGELGRVRFGPAVISAYYRWPELGGIRPYSGLGAAYAIVFNSFDAAVTQLKVHNGWGFALQGGVEYKLNDRFDFFVDYKKIWISLDADGLINGATRATARAKLDPTLISAGLKFHFP